MLTLPSISDLQGIPGVQGAPGRDGFQGAKVKHLSPEVLCVGAWISAVSVPVEIQNIPMHSVQKLMVFPQSQRDWGEKRDHFIFGQIWAGASFLAARQTLFLPFLASSC